MSRDQMICKNVLLILTFVVASSASNSFADIVDQQQLNAPQTLGAFDGQFHNIQSFQQSYNHITGASVAIRNVPIGTTITIRLYDFFGDISDPTKAIGIGSVVTTSTSSTQSQFEQVSFIGGAGQPISPIPVSSSQTLYLAFSKSTGNNLGGFQGSLSNPYGNGQVYSNGNSFPNFDFGFQTFAVPEPSSGSIVAVGLVFAALRRRR